VGYPTSTFDIPSDTSFLAPNSNIPTNIVETLNLRMANTPDTELYQFKIISSLGNIEKLFVTCTGGACGLTGGGGGTFDLYAQLLLDGPNGVNTKTSTAVMFVTNVGTATIYDVAPATACSKGAMFGVTPVSSTGDFNPCDLDPESIDELQPGQTALFKWDGLVTGNVGDVFTFQNFARGYDDESHTNPPVDSNPDIDTLEIIDPNDCGGCDSGGEGGETIILLDDLLIRPSLFMTLPSPFGTAKDTAQNGLWGVNIANPTNSTMDVSKVTITAFAPGSQEQMIVFSTDQNANHENVSPPGAGIGDWCVGKNCGENVATWKNFDSPITLTPYSNESFFFKANPDGTTLEYEAIIVQSSVFTTSGSFGKPGYQTTMFGSGGTNNASPIANVYLTDAINSRDKANILGHRDGLRNGTAHNFAVTLADMDNDDETAIAIGAKLIVNVPREWTNVSIFDGNTTNIEINPNPNPELAEPSIKEHGDGSIQIIATTDTHLGNGTNPNTATLTFTATAPEKQTEKMYIMYVLGYGQTEADFSVGPLSEVVIHVKGNVTGYP
jgi:hypothetical protein